MMLPCNRRYIATIEEALCGNVRWKLGARWRDHERTRMGMSMLGGGERTAALRVGVLDQRRQLG